MRSEGSLSTRVLVGGATLSLLGLVACIAWEGRGSPSVEAGPVYVIFRYDDYSQRSQESVNEAVIAVFRRHEVPVTIAVIPCPADSFAPARADTCNEPLDASRVTTLVDAHREGIAEIALHGYSHSSAGNVPFESEFHGVSPEEQLNRIGRGLDEVERRTRVRPSTFVPPFDAYDLATLGAVEALGMRAISGGRGPSSGQNLAFIPNSVYIKKIREAVNQLREDPDAGAVIVSIFHPWDMEEADQMVPLTGSLDRPFNSEQLDSVLDWLRKQPEVQITTMEALRESGADLSEERFAMAREYSRSATWRILPPRLKGPPRFYLHSVERYRHLEIKLWLRVSTYSLASVVLVAGIVSAGLGFGRRRGELFAMIPRVAIGLAAVVLLGGPWLMGALGWKDYIVLLIALGVSVGGALALLGMRSSSAQPGA